MYEVWIVIEKRAKELKQNYYRCYNVLQTYRTYRYDLRKREESESEPGYKRRIISKYEVSVTQDSVNNWHC